MTPIRLLPLAAGLCMTLALPAAQAERYALQQGGFTTGGSFSGYFEGSDLDGDGILSLADGEITAFELHWQDDAYIAPFTLGLDDLYGFVWKLGRPGLGDDRIGPNVEGIVTRVGNSAGVHVGIGVGATGWPGGQVVELATGHWANSRKLMKSRTEVGQAPAQ